MEYGITENGFVLKRLAVCKQEIEDDFKETFGEDLNLDDTSVAGQIVNIMAKREADLWEKMQADYNATRPSSAVGIPHDDLVAINGIERLPETNSSCYVILYGEDTDVVNAGFTVSRSDDSTIRFILDSDTTISVLNCIETEVDVSSAAAGTYTITIDSVNYSYVAGGADTLATITTGLALVLQSALATTHIIEYDAATDYRISVRPIDNITSFTVSLTGNLAFNTVGTLGLFYSENAGQVQAPVGTLTVIETPDDVDSVYNREPAAIGRLEESDVELRIRRKRVFSGISGGSIPAVETRILEEVPNVSYCRCYENDTDATNSDGIPPHSVEVVVVGGDNSLIAEKLFEVKSGGIGTYGDITVSVLDSLGVSHSINFSRQETLYAWIEYTITHDTEVAFPEDGEDQIREAAKNYCDSQFTIGRDLLVGKIEVPAYSIDGVRDVSVRIATTSTPGGSPSYSASNIVITPKQLVEFDTTRVVVLEA